MAFGPILHVEKPAQGMHVLMERCQGWMLIKEALEALELIGIEALRSHAQQREMAAVALDDWGDLAAEVHEVKH